MASFKTTRNVSLPSPDPEMGCTHPVAASTGVIKVKSTQMQSVKADNQTKNPATLSHTVPRRLRPFQVEAANMVSISPDRFYRNCFCLALNLQMLVLSFSQLHEVRLGFQGRGSRNRQGRGDWVCTPTRALLSSIVGLAKGDI